MDVTLRPTAADKEEATADKICRAQTLTSGTERIAAGELPHAGEQLREPTDAEGHAHDDVGDNNSTDTRVEERQDERRRREREQTTAGIRERLAGAGCGCESVRHTEGLGCPAASVGRGAPAGPQ